MGRRLAPLLGLLAGCLIVVGCLGSVWLPMAFVDLPGVSWLRGNLRVLCRVLVGVGIAGLTAAFVLLRPLRGQLGHPRAILALWTLPFLIAPPILSRDMYAYLDQGWMVKEGLDPYLEGMGTRSPFLMLVDDYWRANTTVYPPLALEIQKLVVDAGHLNGFLTVLLMRVPTLISLALIAILLPRLARALPGAHRDDGRVLWLALLNPVTVIHLVGGGHNDAWMVAIALLAVWVATKRYYGFWLGAVLAGAAACIKQPAMLVAVVVALIAKPAMTLVRRVLWSALAVALAAATFVGISYAAAAAWTERAGAHGHRPEEPIGPFGWATASGSPTKAFTQSPVRLVRQMLIQWLQVPDSVAYPLTTAIGFAVLALILLYHWGKLWRQPLNLGGWGYLGFSALSPTLQIWYLSSPLMFLSIMRLSRLWASVIALWTCELLLANWMTEVLGWPNFNAFFIAAALVAPLAYWLWKWPGNLLEARHHAADLTNQLGVAHVARPAAAKGSHSSASLANTAAEEE